LPAGAIREKILKKMMGKKRNDALPVDFLKTLSGYLCIF
jgi:hypothetical protein